MAGIQLTLARLDTEGSVVPEDVIVTTSSAEDGFYEFGGLPTGGYAIALGETPELRATTLSKVTVELARPDAAVQVSFGVRTFQDSRLYLPLILVR